MGLPESNDPRTIYWSTEIIASGGGKAASVGEFDTFRIAAEQIAALADHPGWTALRQMLERKVETLHLSILPPGAKEHYAFVGTTNQEFALRKVLEMPEAVALAFQRENERRRKAAQRAAGEEQ